MQAQQQQQQTNVTTVPADTNTDTIEQKVREFNKRAMRNIPNQEFISIVRMGGAAMIFAFLALIMALILESYTQAIWYAVITVWGFSLVVFGMCGSRSRSFLGVFSLLHLVLSVAVLWFWFRTMNKIYWNYHDSWAYGELWLGFLFQTVVLILFWVLFSRMQNIDLKYNANRGFYEFLANQQSENAASDYGYTLSYDNNNSSGGVLPTASTTAAPTSHSKRQ